MHLRSIALAAVLVVVAAASQAWGQDVDNSWIQDLDGFFGAAVAAMTTVVFADFGTGLPLIVAVLLGGGIYYSFYFGWMSIRGFKHAVHVLRGHYDKPDDPGEISHFQALTSALSATVGLGNIAGVAPRSKRCSRITGNV